MNNLYICSGAKECISLSCHHIVLHERIHGSVGKLDCGYICANGNHRCIKEKKATKRAVNGL